MDKAVAAPKKRRGLRECEKAVVKDALLYYGVLPKCNRCANMEECLNVQYNAVGVTKFECIDYRRK